MEFFDIAKSVSVAFLATLFCIWLLRPLAFRIGLVDRPGGRKMHEGDIPVIGGIAMFFGFCFALLTLPVSLQPYRGLLAGSGLILLMGVVDDFKELSSKLRLVGQVFAVFILIAWGGQLVDNLGNIFFRGDVHLMLWAFPVTVVAVVGYINAMNMLDGQDGLAGGVAFGQVMLLSALSLRLKDYSDTMILSVVLMLLIAFLGFNLRLPWRKKASIFMGDAGSTFLAFVIAWFAINLSQDPSHDVRPMSVLWVLAFPLFDLISVMLYRLRHKKPILSASRDHLHYLLQMCHIKTSVSTFMIGCLSFLLGVIGMLMNRWKVADGWQFLGLWVALGAYLLMVRFIRSTEK